MKINEKLFNLVNDCANEFSHNKASNKAYKTVFALIYRENIINGNKNTYGYTEINNEYFRKISQKKNLEIRKHLVEKGIVKVNMALGQNTGRSYQDTHYTRGYRIENPIENGNEIDVEWDTWLDGKVNGDCVPSVNPTANIELIHHTINDFHTLLGGVNLIDGQYNVSTVYNCLDVDFEGVQAHLTGKDLQHFTQVWNRHK